MGGPGRRVGVIEIGSRAVRLLVADVGLDGLQPVLTRSKETRLMGALAGPSGNLDRLLSEMEGILEEFEGLARRERAAEVVTFGTEAIRRLLASGQIAAGSALARARILTEDEEASSSAIAAISAATSAAAT